MNRFFCTYFDHKYLVRGITLIQSLRKYLNSFTIFVFYLDDLTYKVLSKLNLQNVILVSINEIEQGDEALLEAKNNRSLLEYYWTLTPTILLRLLQRYPEIDILSYIDADMFFFSTPEPVFAELGANSVLIHEHRFPDRLAFLEPYGKYNVGWLSFCNDLGGKKVLSWWQARCNEWCYRREEDGKFGDQKYLDDWTTRFDCVHVIQNIGAGIAPWNHEQYSYKIEENGQITVNSNPLVFYHFHSLKMLLPGVFQPFQYIEYYPTNEDVLRLCFIPYLLELNKSIGRIKSVMAEYPIDYSALTDDCCPSSFLALRSDRELIEGKIPNIETRELDNEWNWHYSLRNASKFLSAGNEWYTFESESKTLDNVPDIDNREGKLPRFSVITPSFNQGKYIEKCILSVVQQNYPNIEHIVIDGGSDDETITILSKYPGVRWISEKDNGQSDALNKGFDMASGEIIAWINSDDWYEPGVFRFIAKYFNEYPDRNVVMGDCQLWNEEGKTFDKVINYERGFIEMSRYWVGRSIPAQPGIFFRRELLLEFGGLDVNLHYAMDYDLWMRFSSKNWFNHLDLTVANMLFHQGSKSGAVEDWQKFIPECKTVFDRYVKSKNITSSDTQVSVIVPCYNQVAFLPDAIESLVAQTYLNWECIIVNDGSTDNTGEIARQLITRYSQKNIRLIEKDNGGVADARNIGIKESVSRYVLPLDADDKMDPLMLEKLVSHLESNPDVDVVYTDLRFFGSIDGTHEFGELLTEKITQINQLPYCALYRREVWEVCGGYNNNLVLGYEDWDFWISCAEKGFQGLRIPEPLFLYRVKDKSRDASARNHDVELRAQIILNHPDLYDENLKKFAIEIIQLKKEQSKLTAQLKEHERMVNTKKITESFLWRFRILSRKKIYAILPQTSVRTRLIRCLPKPIYLWAKKIWDLLKLRYQMRLIIKSGLFDNAWYLAKNPDVAQNKVDPLLHFLVYGGFEGRDPCPVFSSNWYLNKYSDVKLDGINPLLHYIKYGKDEGRQISP